MKAACRMWGSPVGVLHVAATPTIGPHDPTRMAHGRDPSDLGSVASDLRAASRARRTRRRVRTDRGQEALLR